MAIASVEVKRSSEATKGCQIEDEIRSATDAQTIRCRSFRFLPPLSESWFNTLDAIRAEHFARGPVLVLSQEDWFQYYRDADDVVPLTDYFTQTYAGQPMREVLVDSAFQKEAVTFLSEQLGGADTRLDDCHGQSIGGRFRFYEFSCLTGTR